MKDDSGTELPKLLDVLDSALSAALREIRRARASMAPSILSHTLDSEKRMSNIEICFDILNLAQRPLHVSAIMKALEERGINTSRDSVVSAISKKLAPNGPFVRTAPNTFAVAGQQPPGDT